jgi:hypothetical protein
VVAVSILCSGQLNRAGVDEDAGEKEQRLAYRKEGWSPTNDTLGVRTGKKIRIS